MAGTGPAPTGKAMRRNADSRIKTVEVIAAKQPTLQSATGSKVNPLTNEPWLKNTVLFWKSLATFPTTESLQTPQWLLLAGAMLAYDSYMSGNWQSEQSMRLQLKPFGITPEDLMRQKIQFATVKQAEAQAVTQTIQAEKSLDRYEALKARANK